MNDNITVAFNFLIRYRDGKAMFTCSYGLSVIIT